MLINHQLYTRDIAVSLHWALCRFNQLNCVWENMGIVLKPHDMNFDISSLDYIKIEFGTHSNESQQ